MVLVERDRQLALLSHLLRGCPHDAGSVVVVSGPVAVGKTELLHTFCEKAAGAGIRFLGAAVSPARRHQPFGLLGRLLHGARTPYAQRADAAVTDTRRTDGRVELLVREAVARVFLDMSAAEPLLIGVDDVHHAGTESLQCLLHLARRLERSRIMLVLGDQDRTGSAHSELRNGLHLMCIAGRSASARSPATVSSHCSRTNWTRGSLTVSPPAHSPPPAGTRCSSVHWRRTGRHRPGPQAANRPPASWWATDSPSAW